MDTLKETKPQLLFILALLLVAVLFSLFQAISSLSGESESPEYERVPPAAFAQVPYLTLFPGNINKNNLEEGARLADDDYLALLEESEALTDKVFQGSLSENDLLRAGMSSSEARRYWLQIELLLPRFSEEEPESLRYSPLQMKVEPSLGQDEVVLSVESDVEFELAGNPASLNYVFKSSEEGVWELSSFNIY